MDLAAAKRELAEGRRRALRQAKPDPDSRGETGHEQRGPERDFRKGAAPRRRLDLRDRARGNRLRHVLAHALRVPRQIPRRGVALLGVLGETALHDPAEGRRRLRIQLRHGLRVVLDDGRQRLGAGVALECALARRHLVQNRAESELVRPEVDGPAARLLGRHVADRAHHGAGLRLLMDHRRHTRNLFLGRYEELGKPEVQQLHEAVLRNHDVLGLQVPVNYASGMRLGEAFANLHAEVEQPLRRQRARCKQLAQARPIDELHRDVGGRVGGADLVDRDDVGVIERRGRARLLLETAQAIRVLREQCRQDLDRHFPPQARVLRAIDLTHSSSANRREDLVGTESCSGG